MTPVYLRSIALYSIYFINHFEVVFFGLYIFFIDGIQINILFNLLFLIIKYLIFVNSVIVYWSKEQVLLRNYYKQRALTRSWLMLYENKIYIIIMSSTTFR